MATIDNLLKAHLSALPNAPAPDATGYDVHIRNVETGEVRIKHEDEQWSGIAQYGWEDGNYSCDCNRHLFFERAGGVNDGSEWDGSECGTGRYHVTIFRAGIAVYSE